MSFENCGYKKILKHLILIILLFSHSKKNSIFTIFNLWQGYVLIILVFAMFKRIFCQTELRFQFTWTKGPQELLASLGIVVCKFFTFQASSLKPLGQLEPNLAGMFLGWSSTKYLFFVPVGYSTWLPCPIICSDWLKFQRSSSLKLMN